MASTNPAKKPSPLYGTGSIEPLTMVDFGNHLIIKCVVVGDTRVGKSHLVCARASGTKYTLRDLVLQSPVSSVWAVDQYRDNYEVQRRSRCDIDGVSCSLRIWDTFGTHDKDRLYAYMHTDVVVICFSAISRKSLMNVENFWIPEVQRICGIVPIIICCCQIDYRYLFTDPFYINLDKGPFGKKVKPGDIVLPEEGRAVARKFGASYYESSVLAQYGIDDVFNNAVRSCLFQKRRSQIFSKIGNLKRVTKPHLQVPHLPPRPAQPEFEPTDAPLVGTLRPSRSRHDLQSYCDVTFILDGDVRLYAHWVYLIAASPAFHQLYDQRRRHGRPLDLSRSSGFISVNSCSSSSTVIGSGGSSSSDATLNSWTLQPPWRRDGVRIRMSSRIRYLSQNFDPSSTSGTSGRNALPLDDDSMSVDGGIVSAAASDNHRRRQQQQHRLVADSNNDLVKSTTTLADREYDDGGSQTFQTSERSAAPSMLTLTPSGDGDVDEDNANGDDEADNEHDDDEDDDRETEFSDYESTGYTNQTVSAATSVASFPSTAFVSIEVRGAGGNKHGGLVGGGDVFEESVVVVDDSISVQTFEDVLHFVYTGNLPSSSSSSSSSESDGNSDDTDLIDRERYERLNRAARAIGFVHLDAATSNALSGDQMLNVELQNKFRAEKSNRIEQLILKQGLLADVLVELEDGKVPAHRALLMCRSDMMVSMFNLDFNERCNRTIPFKSATVGGFRGLMTYLYTGHCPEECDDWACLIELSDRLCLPQLRHDSQRHCINHLSQLMHTADIGEMTDSVLALVDAAKLHNTEPIERWCLWYLQVNFNEVFEKHFKTLEALQPETRNTLVENRWPPAWYLKEVDFYERALMLITKERPESSWLRRPNGEVHDSTHCFGFLRKRI